MYNSRFRLISIFIRVSSQHLFRGFHLTSGSYSPLCRWRSRVPSSHALAKRGTEEPPSKIATVPVQRALSPLQGFRELPQVLCDLSCCAGLILSRRCYSVNTGTKTKPEEGTRWLRHIKVWRSSCLLVLVETNIDFCCHTLTMSLKHTLIAAAAVISTASAQAAAYAQCKFRFL